MVSTANLHPYNAALIPAAEQLATLPLPADNADRCQFLVAETMFGEMLALPEPPFPQVRKHFIWRIFTSG